MSHVFFFNDTATTEIYTRSLHDALPICYVPVFDSTAAARCKDAGLPLLGKTNLDEFAMGSSTENSGYGPDRKSTRLNSRHANISYAVFCLTKERSFAYG